MAERMTPNRKVSIVIPVYNGSDYLREAIDSALGQTYPNVEVIVVNDGSDDGGETENVAKSFGDRIRYFRKTNGGVASALNHGISVMTGDYFAWLSHDDLYLPKKTAVQMEYADREGDGAILYSDYEFIDSDSRPLNVVRMPTGPSRDFRLRLMLDRSMHGCTLLIPRECFRAAGLFNESLKTTQDYDLWFRMAERFRFVHVPRTLVRSRVHPGQTSNTVKPLHMKECNELLVDWLRRQGTREVLARDGWTAETYYSLAVNWKIRGFQAAAECAYSYYDRFRRNVGAWSNLRRGFRRWNFETCDKRFNVNYWIHVSRNIYSVKIVPMVRRLVPSEQSPRSVLFLASWFPSAGNPLEGIFIRKHAEAVGRYCRISVLTVAFADDPTAPRRRLEVLEKEGVRGVRVSVRRHPGNRVISSVVSLGRYLSGCWAGYRKISATYGRPDLAHVNVAMPVGIFALALRWFLGIPYVITEHNSIYTEYDGRYLQSSRFNKWATRIVFRNAGVVSAVSRFLLDALRRHGLVRNSGVTIPNVVDAPVEPEGRSGGEGRLKLLSVSLLNDRDKNITGMLRAFRSVRELFPEAELHLVGSGRDLRMIEGTAGELGLLGKGVFLKGYVPNGELHREFRDAAFFVLNSNYETFSVATAEAIAHGIPVLVTRCGGPEEYVSDQVGIVVERNDEAGLARGMIRMIEGFREYHSDRLRRYAGDRFGHESVGRTICRMYSAVSGR